MEHYISATEKFLKQIVYDIEGPESDILYTHNIAKIFVWLTRIIDLPVKKSEMYWMTSFYHDSRYPLHPGTIVTTDDRDHARDLCFMIKRFVLESGYGTGIEYVDTRYKKKGA